MKGCCFEGFEYNITLIVSFIIPFVFMGIRECYENERKTSTSQGVSNF